MQHGPGDVPIVTVVPRQNGSVLDAGMEGWKSCNCHALAREVRGEFTASQKSVESKGTGSSKHQTVLVGKP